MRDKKSYYERYGIYELRKIARDKGVKSPTILRRSEIIEKIELIESGIEKPCFNSKNRGRPAKEIEITKYKNYNCKDCKILKNITERLKELENMIEQYINEK
ncbi:MAG: hypothetical protein KBT30_01945 [Clostridiales bacterium]|nr:hypothetical protein [Candidatus Apopatousia equi]